MCRTAGIGNRLFPSRIVDAEVKHGIGRWNSGKNGVGRRSSLSGSDQRDLVFARSRRSSGAALWWVGGVLRRDGGAIWFDCFNGMAARCGSSASTGWRRGLHPGSSALRITDGESAVSSARGWNQVGRLSQVGVIRAQIISSTHSTSGQRTATSSVSLEDQHNHPEKNVGGEKGDQFGKNVSRKDKVNFLVRTLQDLNNSKQAVYGALDGWVAWEQDFPIGKIRMALTALEKEEQWHRIVQVIKWMLSKGQGNTMGTYGQLIRALDMDQRPEEAHKFWEKKIGIDMHSVPWQLCKSIIGIYYRNNMLENLVKLFEGLEAFDRKPPEKSIVRKVADAYEMLGRIEQKERVLQKYNYLFEESGSLNKSKKGSKKKKQLEENI